MLSRSLTAQERTSVQFITRSTEEDGMEKGRRIYKAHEPADISRQFSFLGQNATHRMQCGPPLRVRHFAVSILVRIIPSDSDLRTTCPQRGLLLLTTATLLPFFLRLPPSPVPAQAIIGTSYRPTRTSKHCQAVHTSLGILSFHHAYHRLRVGHLDPRRQV